MSKHYGVLCHFCERPIPLADYEETFGTDIAFYTVQSAPIKCTNPPCDKEDSYAPKEGIFFELVAPTPTDTGKNHS